MQSLSHKFIYIDRGEHCCSAAYKRRYWLLSRSLDGFFPPTSPNFVFKIDNGTDFPKYGISRTFVLGVLSPNLRLCHLN